MNMKVGMIGLGRTGEGMARRMLAKGIEVWGYSSTNYENACGQYEAGYISGCVTSLAVSYTHLTLPTILRV